MQNYNDFNQNVWSRHYNREYSFLKFPDENVVRYFQKQENLKNKIILDLGAGTCRNSFFLAQICKSVTAQDYVALALERAKKSNSAAKNISFVHSHANNLPYPGKLL